MTTVTVDRKAQILVRHKRRVYLCSVGYSDEDEEFHHLGTRSEGGVEYSTSEIYQRVLSEPALRADLFRQLLPLEKATIRRLSEEALHTRAQTVGVWAGFTAFLATGIALLLLAWYLGERIGWDNTELILAIPTFFAFVVYFPASHYFRWRYVRQHWKSLKDSE